MDRPENHVTRAQREGIFAGSSLVVDNPPPALDEGTILWLEEVYPERCLRPGDDVATHLHYAGKVDLVAYLRLQYDRQQAEPLEDGAEVAVIEPGD